MGRKKKAETEAKLTEGARVREEKSSWRRWPYWTAVPRVPTLIPRHIPPEFTDVQNSPLFSQSSQEEREGWSYHPHITVVTSSQQWLNSSYLPGIVLLFYMNFLVIWLCPLALLSIWFNSSWSESLCIILFSPKFKLNMLHVVKF